MRFITHVLTDKIDFYYPTIKIMILSSVVSLSILAGGLMFTYLSFSREPILIEKIFLLVFLASGLALVFMTIYMLIKTGFGRRIRFAQLDETGITIQPVIIGKELEFGWQSVSKVEFVEKLVYRTIKFGNVSLGTSLLIYFGSVSDSDSKKFRRGGHFVKPRDNPCFIKIQVKSDDFRKIRDKLVRLTKGKLETTTRPEVRFKS